MGWRYRKRIKILPGIHINISKSGISTNIGVKGANITFGPKGTYVNTGFPGTGLYRRDKISNNATKYSSIEDNLNENRTHNNTYSFEDKVSVLMPLYYVLYFISIVSPIIFFKYHPFNIDTQAFYFVDAIIQFILSLVIIINTQHKRDYATQKSNNVNNFNNCHITKRKKSYYLISCIYIFITSIIISTNLLIYLREFFIPIIRLIIYFISVLGALLWIIAIFNRKYLTTSLDKNVLLKNSHKEIERKTEEYTELDLQPQDDVSSAIAAQTAHSQTLSKPAPITKRPLKAESTNGAYADNNMPYRNKDKDENTINNLTIEQFLSTPIDPREPYTRYKFPSLSLLKKYDTNKHIVDYDEIKANNNRIVEVLHSFGVEISRINATIGPTISLYEFTLAEGVRINKVLKLEDDIILNLSSLNIRRIAPIPENGTIGIEVLNQNPQIVSIESVLNSKRFQETRMTLPVAIGKTISNEVYMFDLHKLPHLLIAGSTGQGKSVALNVIITSLLYRKHPNELKFVLIDPNKIEFSLYNKIAPHYMACLPEYDEEPIISDVQKAVRTLNSLCKLMERRYDLLKMAQVKKIEEYNEKFIHHRLDLRKGHEYMPYIVVIIDEFSDLIIAEGQNIESPITRIAQSGRTVGIHMVISTNRPTNDIITGHIKANIPARMAFRLPERIDSQVILDYNGAEKLTRNGEMLFRKDKENDFIRIQCAFIDTPEIESIIDHIAEQPGPVEPASLPEPTYDNYGEWSGGEMADLRQLDPYFNEAAHAIVLSQQGSTSMIQRRFSIGYNRAGRLMDQLEQAGIVGAAMGSQPRDVLVQDENTLNKILTQLNEM